MCEDAQLFLIGQNCSLFAERANVASVPILHWMPQPIIPFSRELAIVGVRQGWGNNISNFQVMVLVINQTKIRTNHLRLLIDKNLGW